MALTTIRGSAKMWVTAGLVVVLLGAAGATCSESPTPPGDDASADRGMDATVTSECRGVRSENACRVQSSCRWLELTCDTGGVAAGCVDRSRRSTELPFGCAGEGTETSADVGATDAQVDCQSYGSSAVCEARPDCRWWSQKCGGRVVDQRCISRSAVPERPNCADGGWRAESDAAGSDTSSGDVGVDGASSDAGGCGAFDQSENCRDHSACRWWSATCNGHEVDSRCLREDEPEPEYDCEPTAPANCHEAEEESACWSDNCEWVVEGCTGAYGDAEKLTGCLPAGTCRDDAECPSDHSCETLWVDPCHDQACTACAGTESRCVPTSELD